MVVLVPPSGFAARWTHGHGLCVCLPPVLFLAGNPKIAYLTEYCWIFLSSEKRMWGFRDAVQPALCWTLRYWSFLHLLMWNVIVDSLRFQLFLKNLVIMFKTGIIGYWKYLKNKHWMQFMELSAIEANGI